MASPRPLNSARFAKTRAAHRDEIGEDYVEAIADLIDEQGEARVGDLARLFGVSHVTVSRKVSRLSEAGLVRTSPYKPVELTRSGRALARRSRARHELVVSFLVSLGVPRSDAEVDAEGIEHHVGPSTLRAMKRHLAD